MNAWRARVKEKNPSSPILWSEVRAVSLTSVLASVLLPLVVAPCRR